MYRINYLFALLAAPFLALFLVCSGFVEDSIKLGFPIAPLEEGAAMLQQETDILRQSIVDLGLLARMQEDTFSEQYESLSTLSEKSVSHRKLSDDIYEQKILDMLGPTVSAHISDNNEIKIFKLAELGYRGFIAKVKLFKPKSFKVVLAQDTPGKLETTSEAAKRTGAMLAINGGGFYTEVRSGETYAQMIGNTVIGGKLVEPFNDYPGNLFFAGINKKGQVIGGVPQTEKELTALKPYQGVSFIPVLLKDGKSVDIPDEWKATNQPRTIIGKYANDDLIMIAIDGRQGDWSVGVTLEHLQDKLSELGVKEAYNLDGGGSSTMYFNGVVLNRPSDGKERPVVNNIIVLP